MTGVRTACRSIVGAIGLCLAGAANADAVVTACGKDVWPGDPRTDLGEALALGGRITFACSGPIVFSRSHALTKDVEIDGGGAVTLDGAGQRMFGLGSGRGLRFSTRSIRIVGAGVGSGGLPGGVVSGQGDVALLEGTTVSKSEQPVWVGAGSVVLRNALLFENTGPVIVVSEGSLDIGKASRFTDNAGQALATGPAVRVRIDDTQFFRNGASSFGGAAAGACEVAITNAWFADNVGAEDGGAFVSRCRTRVDDSQFERNRAARDGGAVFLGTGAGATLRAVRFRGNRAARSGGAIAGVWPVGLGGDLLIRNGRFEDNQAGAAGGAILAGESSRLEIAVSAFVANLAGTGGGALYVRQTPLQVGRTLFLKNRSAGSGGAIESLCMPAGAGRIANSILAGNAAAAGSSFYGTHTTFVNATIVGSGDAQVRQGAVCAGASSIGFVNTIIEGGWRGGCAGADAERTFRDLGHNVQFPGQSCGPTVAAAFPLLGLFFAPLRPLSPAGSSGDAAICAAAPVSGRDLYGAHRPQGAACSIGAVEGDFSQALARWLKRRRGDSALR